MNEKTGASIMMSEHVMSRGRAAAMLAFCRTEDEIQAFIAGANWFWEQQKRFTMARPFMDGDTVTLAPRQSGANMTDQERIAMLRDALATALKFDGTGMPPETWTDIAREALEKTQIQE